MKQSLNALVSVNSLFTGIMSRFAGDICRLVTASGLLQNYHNSLEILLFFLTVVLRFPSYPMNRINDKGGTMVVYLYYCKSAESGV